jgi:hypothetical protein
MSLFSDGRRPGRVFLGRTSDMAGVILRLSVIFQIHFNRAISKANS